MAETDQAADAALADVLSDPAPVSDRTEGEPLPDQASSREMLCSEDDARALVDEVKAALAQFDSSMQRIVELRAWEPLGYANPRDFVMSEFGPRPGSDEDHRVSRQHAYRLARLAMFMYGLSVRLGDGVAFDLSERALRSLPQGLDGANDLVVLDRVQQRWEQAQESGEDVTEESAQQILDEELSKARQQITEHGALDGLVDTDDEAPDDLYDDDLDGDTDDSGPARSGQQPPASSDPFESGLDATDGPVGESDGDTPKQASASHLDDEGAFAAPSASADAMEQSQRLNALLRGLQSISEVAEHLPQIVEYASPDEMDRLVAEGQIAVDVARKIVAAAEELSDDFMGL